MSAGKLVVSTEEISQIQESAKDVADQGPPGAGPSHVTDTVVGANRALIAGLVSAAVVFDCHHFAGGIPQCSAATPLRLDIFLVHASDHQRISHHRQCDRYHLCCTGACDCRKQPLPDFDDRSDFPQLPVKADLNSSEASRDLKPLVIVVSTAMRMWRSQESASGMIGAGVLLYSDQNGYLFATARHMIAHGGWNSAEPLHMR